MENQTEGSTSENPLYSHRTPIFNYVQLLKTMKVLMPLCIIQSSQFNRKHKITIICCLQYPLSGNTSQI